MDYVSCGNVMLDRIESRNGELGPLNLGGPALYALSGIRVWTENCTIACRAGADFDLYFGPWMSQNGISSDNIHIETENNIEYIIKRRDQLPIHWNPVYGIEHKGYLRVTPELIDEATDHETKGVFLVQNEDRIFWQKVYEIKTRKGFKVLWEYEDFLRTEKPSEQLRRIQQVIPMTDMFSLTLPEASRLFGIAQRDEEAIINRIMTLPVELTLLRLGNNGSWAITPTTAAHCDAIDIPDTVDPLGCGSTASGAALYAHCEGYNPAMVAVMANVSAGYTAAQLGPVQNISEQIMEEAKKLSEVQYKKVIARKKQ